MDLIYRELASVNPESAEVGYFIPDEVIPLSLARHDVDQPTIFSVLINLGRNECYYQFLLSMLGYLEEDHGCQEGFVFIFCIRLSPCLLRI
ncbi:hypothetical protein OUZ56_010556 [Daphnia magna]|uniref:Uncharacterized protein n=1 Tax=Daphnia magna TaxID=35525 RepID=A0ABR0AIW7_9CRUS|nr:hypothetical protein OUZ56_010556 [Daphnia magna]